LPENSPQESEYDTSSHKKDKYGNQLPGCSFIYLAVKLIFCHADFFLCCSVQYSTNPLDVLAKKSATSAPITTIKNMRMSCLQSPPWRVGQLLNDFDWSEEERKKDKPGTEKRLSRSLRMDAAC